ncbi:MAG: hypothetical protein AAB116_13285 [Candidatus Poribacteria bacterium]
MDVYKKWVLVCLASIILLILLVMTVNFTIDPLWCFSLSNRFNNCQEDFNERQQKINRITFGDFSYDTLILGSSRSTYINQNDFIDFHAFNCSVSSMVPSEYSVFVNYAKQKAGKDFKCIIIGMDFYGTNANLDGTKYIGGLEIAESCIKEANEPLYRYRNLASIDTLRYSLKNIKRAVKNNFADAYNRNNIKFMMMPNDAQKQSFIAEQLYIYEKIYYGVDYKYRENLKNIFLTLKRDNPNSKIIIYTTPISEPLLKLLIKQGLFKYYQRMIKDIASIFGEVYDFMGINSITTNPDNYKDSHHFSPEVGTLMAHRVIGYKDARIPSDFGILIKKDNVDEYLKKQETRILDYFKNDADK